MRICITFFCLICFMRQWRVFGNSATERCSNKCSAPTHIRLMKSYQSKWGLFERAFSYLTACPPQTLWCHNHFWHNYCEIWNLFAANFEICTIRFLPKRVFIQIRSIKSKCNAGNFGTLKKNKNVLYQRYLRSCYREIVNRCKSHILCRYQQKQNRTVAIK